jgi:predicted permease
VTVAEPGFAIGALLPMFVYFLIGVFLRRSGVATGEHAGFLFRMMFLVTLPALVFTSVSGADLKPGTALLPVSGFLINLLCATLAAVVVRLRALPAPQAGAIVVSVSVMNMGYMFPFILATLGEDALASAILFDAGNAVFVATLCYPIAQYYGHSKAEFSSASVKRVLLSPIFIAIAAALVFNLGDVTPPSLVTRTLGPLGSATIPLMLLAVGMSFGGFASHVFDAMNAVALRMIVGGLFGWLLVTLFGFGGTTAIVVIVSAAAPVGATAAAFAAVSDLDREVAVNAISISALMGLVSSSALLLLLSRVFA